MEIVIKCGTCKKEKSEEEFNIYHGKRGKSCKQCRKYYNNLWKTNKEGYKEKRQLYYRENKDKHRFRNFKNAIFSKYSLTIENYEKMLNNQNNQCAMCGKNFILDGSKSNLNLLPCVDHNHQTHKVRGLLCRLCNTALGYVESGLVDKAKEYLRVYDTEDKEPLL